MSHPAIKQFIERKLSETLESGEITEFTYSTVWAQIQNCFPSKSVDIVKNMSIDTCAGCGDRHFPCRRLREVASYWSDDKNFKESWGF